MGHLCESHAMCSAHIKCPLKGSPTSQLQLSAPAYAGTTSKMSGTCCITRMPSQTGALILDGEGMAPWKWCTDGVTSPAAATSRCLLSPTAHLLVLLCAPALQTCTQARTSQTTS